METSKILLGKRILIVDDERDILETLIELLSLCKIDAASSFEEGKRHLERHNYDLVILDIMGVKGFDLLDIARGRGTPVLMLTAHALTPDSLKKSIRLGAVSFLPKERMGDLVEHLEDVVLEGGKPAWQKLFDKLGDLFNKRFGPGWKEKDRFFKEFEEELRKSEGS